MRFRIAPFVLLTGVLLLSFLPIEKAQPRFGGDPMDRYIFSKSDSGATDCGQVLVGENPSLVNGCASLMARFNRPFQAKFDLSDHETERSRAFVMTSRDRLYELALEGARCGRNPVGPFEWLNLVERDCAVEDGLRTENGQAVCTPISNYRESQLLGHDSHGRPVGHRLTRGIFFPCPAETVALP